MRKVSSKKNLFTLFILLDVFLVALLAYYFINKRHQPIQATETGTEVEVVQKEYEETEFHASYEEPAAE